MKKFRSGMEMDLSFKNFKNNNLFEEIGKFILKSCRKIPQGIIVFIKSYHLLENLISVLINSQIISQIVNLKKVAIEQKTNKENNEQKKKFLTNAYSGAILFAVMGGKFSEGFDFTDYMARGVIILGIPYANFKDKKLKAKQEYLVKNKGINKNEWYREKAIRLVNQSIGRSIRHSKDYSMVFLLDTNFEQSFDLFSDWFKDKIIINKTEDEIYNEQERFFKGDLKKMRDKKLKKFENEENGNYN